jgi:hypothetical protein
MWSSHQIWEMVSPYLGGFEFPNQTPREYVYLRPSIFIYTVAVFGYAGLS